MELPQLLLLNGLIAAGAFTALWFVSLPLRDASIVDPFWGAGFALLAWVSFAAAGGDSPRAWLLPALTSLWGLRLSGYLAWRNFGKGEDYRYQAMRKRFGHCFWWVSLMVVFWLQAAIQWVVALPVQVGGRGDANLNWLDFAGIATWTIGWLFEAVGDWQLARFKANPANRSQVCDRGLWRYTRHPNYFGDFLVWWGLYLVAAAGGAAWWIVVSPLLMSLLLMRVSGVTLLEKTLRSAKPGYAEYVRRTSAFFPWFPRAERNEGSGTS